MNRQNRLPDVPALLFDSRQVAPEARVDLRTPKGAEAATDFLTDFRHPQVSFGQVVCEWNT